MMGLFDSLREAAGPGVAIELAADHVSAASLDTRGGTSAVTVHASEPLPPGALVPSLTAANVHNRQVVSNALERVLERTGNPRRVGLVIPDLVAKVSLVRFEHVPARTSDLDQLVRWQVRKTAPFPIEDAQVSYVPGIKAAMRFADASAYVAAGKDPAPALAPKALLPVGKLFDPVERAQLSGKVYFDRLPKDLRAKLGQGIDEGDDFAGFDFLKLLGVPVGHFSAADQGEFNHDLTFIEI